MARQVYILLLGRATWIRMQLSHCDMLEGRSRYQCCRCTNPCRWWGIGCAPLPALKSSSEELAWHLLRVDNALAHPATANPPALLLAAEAGVCPSMIGYLVQHEWKTKISQAQTSMKVTGNTGTSVNAAEKVMMKWSQLSYLQALTHTMVCLWML